MFDITQNGPGGFGWGWTYGTGSGAADGSLSCNSAATEIGSNYDGAVHGLVVDVTTEQTLYVDVNLHGIGSATAVGLWGYANAEPMFDVWIIGLDPSTQEFTSEWQVGIDLRAVAPGFGWVELDNQPRAATPNGNVSRISTGPGRVFVGGGVKTYAGTGGFGAVARSSITGFVDLIRVAGW